MKVDKRNTTKEKKKENKKFPYRKGGKKDGQDRRDKTGN